MRTLPLNVRTMRFSPSLPVVSPSVKYLGSGPGSESVLWQEQAANDHRAHMLMAEAMPSPSSSLAIPLMAWRKTHVLLMMPHTPHASTTACINANSSRQHHHGPHAISTHGRMGSRTSP